MTPSMVRHAYGFDQVVFNTSSGAVAGDGRGQTIAIVDAYNDPFVTGDLDAFDRNFSINGGQSLYTQYGAASNFLTVAAATGTRNSASWSGEIALDVEWAHAIAPGAKILLVEARSSGFNDLLAAVNYARSQPGVVAVSMSWGSGEFSGETSATYQSYFTTPAGHTGITFVGASGDSGAPAIWPAVSTNVLGVGGTALNVDSSGNYVSESAWADSGGGASSFFSKPAYQSAYGGAMRGSPDVAYDASPNTGFYVYNSYDGGWEVVGGTSAGAPQWSALLAIADQGRAISGVGSLDGVQSTLPAIYILPQSDFHDVTTGSNGLAATAGYDLVTGRGSPRANLVVRDLVGNRTVAASLYPATPSGTGPNGSIGNAAVVTDSATPTQTTDAIDLRGLRPAEAPVATTVIDEVPWRAPRSTPDWLSGVVHSSTSEAQAAPDLAVFAGAEDSTAEIDISA
jgi:subtilase family serine protease